MTDTMPMTGAMPGMDHGAAASDIPFDAQFIDSMIEHHQGAITMAELVLAQESSMKNCSRWPNAIISAQQGEIDQMKAWRAAWYPDLPVSTGMGMDMGEMVIADDATIPFDQRFLTAMISHHSGAIMMAESALTQAEHVEIRQIGQSHHCRPGDRDCTDAGLAQGMVRR